MAQNEDNELDRFCDRIEAESEGILLSIPKATAPRVPGWDDNLLRTLRTRFSFKQEDNFRGRLPGILARFYNFYFTGSTPQGVSVLTVIADATLCAKVGNNIIFGPETHEAEGFYTTCSETTRLVESGNLGNLPRLVFPETIRSAEEREAYSKLMITYTPAQMDTFLDAIRPVLTNINPQQHATTDETQLTELTGFLALTLWRSATKTKDQIANAFLKGQYKANLKALTSWLSEAAFCPPCDTCIQKCSEALVKGLASTGNMFTAITFAYLESRSGPNVNNSIAGYLSASVLTHTARNGLGMIQMLEHCMVLTRRSWLELSRLTMFSNTKGDWDKIHLFFKKFFKEDSTEYCFHWARIINDGYLRDYSPKEMIFLAGIFGGIIEKVQGGGIWEAEWAKGNEPLTQQMRVVGNIVYEHCLPDIGKLAKGRHTKPIATAAIARIRAERDENGVEEAIESLPEGI